MKMRELFYTQGVTGSNPVPPTIFYSMFARVKRDKTHFHGKANSVMLTEKRRSVSVN